MSVAARSPIQCPGGSRMCAARLVGAFGSRPDSQSSSRPSATPMQPATVATLWSGDSGWIWSRTAAARAVSPSAMASVTWRSAVAASSRARPVGVNRARFWRSTARSRARCRVSRSGTSMSLSSPCSSTWMPSSASSGASSRSISRAIPGLELDLRAGPAAAPGRAGACPPWRSSLQRRCLRQHRPRTRAGAAQLRSRWPPGSPVAAQGWPSPGFCAGGR